jgi:hypothetical protein
MKNNLEIEFSTSEELPWALVFKGRVISRHRTRSEAKSAYDRTSATLDIKK